MSDEVLKIQFVGPMQTLTKGKRKFEKGHVYTCDGEAGRLTEEEGQALIENGTNRFKEYVPKGQRPQRGGSRVRLTMGGRVAASKGEDDEIAEGEQDQEDANKPKLPAEGFKSKNDAIAFAKKHYDVDLDRKVSLTALNRQVVEAHTKKYPARENPAASLDDDDGEIDTGHESGVAV